jgi:hypothetical protein
MITPLAAVRVAITVKFAGRMALQLLPATHRDGSVGEAADRLGWT